MRKIFQTLLATLAVAATYTACTPEVDDVFDKSSAQRIAETLTEQQKVLVSAPNGWHVAMYGNKDFGGYHVFLKFAADNTVEVASEVSVDLSVETQAQLDSSANVRQTSHYKLEQSGGVVLSFDEYNPLFHYFSDPINPDGMGTAGRGFEADLEYRILSASADSVVLRGKKQGNKLVMLPVADGFNISQYMIQTRSIEEEMINARFAVMVNDKKYTTTQSYRSLTISTVNEAGDRKDVKCPYLVTPQGYEFLEPVTIDGLELTGFKYVKDKDEYGGLSSDSYQLIKIFPPLTEYLTTDYWIFGQSTMGEYAQENMNFIAYVEQVIGEQLQYLLFGLYNGNFGITFNSSGYGGSLLFDYQILGEDRIALKFKAGNPNDNGWWYVQNAEYTTLAEPFGVGEARIFKLTTDNQKSPSYILMTDESDPTNTIQVCSWMVAPLN